MKAVLTKEEYKEFCSSVDFLNKEYEIFIPYSVEEVENKFKIELLNPDNIDVEYLDNLLENT